MAGSIENPSLRGEDLRKRGLLLKSEHGVSWCEHGD